METKQQTIERICSGCESNNKEKRPCLFPRHDYKICPCSTCLVKGICNMPCLPFLDYCGICFRHNKFRGKIKELL